MPSTTANDDVALLDSVEHSVMENWEKVTIEFNRIGLATPDRGWQISYTLHANSKDSKGTLMGHGGGRTLREALENALVGRTIERLAR